MSMLSTGQVVEVLGIIANAIVQEVDLLNGIEGQVEWIEKELRMIYASLVLVEGMECPAKDSSEWAEEARKIVRDVDDFIKIFQNSRSPWPINILKGLFRRHSFAMKLVQIKVHIRAVSKRSRLLTSFSQSQHAYNSRPTHFHVARTSIASVTSKASAVLSQSLLVKDEVAKRVELTRDQFIRLQRTLDELDEEDRRSKAWIDEVEELSKSTERILVSFMNEREQQLLGIFKMPSLIYKDRKFGRAMQQISISVQNLYGRKWTYSIGNDSEGRKEKHASTILGRDAVTLYDPLVENLLRIGVSMFIEELASWQAVSDRLQSMTRDLKLMQALIDDVTDKEGLDQRVCVWVEEVKDIACHADDLVNNSKQYTPKGSDFGFRKFLARRKIGKKIGRINMRIQDISERKWIYDIRDIGGKKRLSSNLRSQCLEEESSNNGAVGCYNMVTSPDALQNSTHLSEKMRFDIRRIHLSVIQRWLTYFLPKLYSVEDLHPKMEWIQWELKLMNALFVDVEPIQNQDKRVQLWVERMQGVAIDARKLIHSYDNVERVKKVTFKRNFLLMEISRIKNAVRDISRIKGTYAISGISERKGHSSTGDTQLERAPPISEITETPTDTCNLERAPRVFLHQKINSRHEPWELLIRRLLSVLDLEESVGLIKRERRFMCALFEDVGAMDRLDEMQKVWVDEIRAVADDADASIDMYNEIKAGWNYLKRVELGRKIEVVLSKIQDISERRMAYGIDYIKRKGEQNTEVRNSNEALPPTFDIEVAGTFKFNNDLQAVISQLLMDNQKGTIISIVGMKGIGKTTLVKSVCNSDAVKDRFPCRVLVSIPSNSNSRAPLEGVEVEVMGMEWKGKGVEEEKPNHVLNDLLTVEPCLLVLDDVSSNEVWDELKAALPSTLNGIRIVLTTRRLGVAKHADPKSVPHKLHLLSDEDSWELFSLSLTLPPVPRVLELSRKSVIQCGGLPKTIVDLRKQLSDLELTSEAWLGLLENLKLNQDSWQETLEVITSGDLPLSLSRCLSYVGQFPMDFDIPVRRLVALWVAEGLLRQSSGDKHLHDEEPPESVGKRYLTDLISRNMVQVTKKKLNGEVKKCRLPHALQKLLHTHRIDHLVDYYNPSDAIFGHIHGDTRISTSSLWDYKGVTSFTSFDAREGSKPGEEIGKFLNRCISSRCFLLLRVLDFEHVFRPELPKALGKLIRLRYLGLRWTFLEILPPFISKLLNLQILDVKHTSISTLPRSIWKMHQLRHLYLNESYRCRLASPQRGNSLTNLQTLWGVFIDEDSPVKDGLDRLLNLKRLGLASRLMAARHESAMLSKLEAVADWVKELKQLQSLRLKSCDELNQPWNLPLKPLSGHTNLSTIYLLGKIENQLVLSGLPRSLTELTLSGSGLKEDPMTALEKLPVLKILRLLGDSFIGTYMHCSSNGFLQLRVLKLWKLMQLEKWEVENGALPSLLQLEIRSCINLKMRPGGLQLLRSLQLKSNMPEMFMDEIIVKNSVKCAMSTQDSKEPLIRQKGYLHQGHKTQPILYLDSFPDGLRPYIDTVKDVAADGNCGFRAIADLMGMGEDNWARVRRNLKEELESCKDHYNKLYGKERADELFNTLAHLESSPGRDGWMTMPDMGHLIASCYNVVLLHISMQLCLTFLPLRHKPLSTLPHRVIAIGFVNDNHFVEIFMLPNSPVPPIASNWYKYRQPCAHGWETPYTERIEVFNELVGDDVATQETIDLDE